MKQIKNKKHFAWKVLTGFALTVMAMVALSCSDELVDPTNNEELSQDSEFFIIGNSSTGTRVTYDTYNQSSFDEGDVVGVYLLEKEGGVLKSVGGETYENVPYKVVTVKNITTEVTKQVLKPAGDKEIPQANGYTYAFVYPYVKGQTYNDLAKLSHQVESGQSTSENFEKSDLLWDVKTAMNNAAHITMHHAMAQIIVEVEESYIDEGASVQLTSKPKTKVANLNLSSVDGAYTAVTNDDLSEENEITMWDFGYSESGNRLFRAAIPAQSNISKDKFLTFKKDGKNKTYSLKEALTVEAGKNYIFAIRKNTIQPDINDDDSWVLDVLDPETGEPVGLLCREYVRYQPNDIDTNSAYEFDVNTGTSNENDSKWITSQAWVFYNLQDFTSRIPNLNKGTVLRFIYDFEKPGFVWWPCEDGHNYVQHGIFAPVHGAHWCKPYDNYADGKAGGHEVYDEYGKPKIEEYYMHGGTIKWDGNNNKIQSFTMPTAPNDKITCKDALEKGHIAIEGENVYVSYKNYEDEEATSGIKRGIIVPHYLVDRRISQEGVLEINKYPLVKIGYNQFWMSKSLNAKTMTDGTSLTCYNKDGSAGVTFGENDEMTAGYIYPYVKNVDDGNGGKVDYDPFNNKTQMAGYGSFKPLPMYNNLCLMNDKFLPKATDSRLKYIIPAKEEIEEMIKYFGKYFPAKLMSRYHSIKPTWNKANEFTYSSLQSLIRGEFRGGGAIGDMDNQDPANAYTANVSGFNCRAIGYYDAYTSKVKEATGTCFIQLRTTDKQKSPYLVLRVYDAWGSKGDNFNDGYRDWDYRSTQYFGQVRFVMKFKNQADTVGSSSNAAATRATSTSAAAKSSSNNVYVQLIEK